jgi:glyoxylase-like metal-dependent hydrolase (beta-lactamase superfamily II)/rhodanese-related sulfurtransferase
MVVKQFYDEALSHLSYAVASDGEAALIDPARDPAPYLEFSDDQNSTITSVFETHPHADFASSHREFHTRYGAKIFINPKVKPHYPYSAMRHGDEVQIGRTTVKAYFTPGHSPDHNAYLIVDEKGKDAALFTGDSLFVGDVGRPDLREGTGNMHVSRHELAKMMYGTIHQIFGGFADEVIVYPAHGPGSLCGKNMGAELQTTIGQEKENNWAFQIKEEDAFVEEYLKGQTYVPRYFPFEVELNRTGAPPLEASVRNKQLQDTAVVLEHNRLLIDVRDEETFKKGHIDNAINIQLEDASSKFETWLGSIVGPEEDFILIGIDAEECRKAIRRAARIGYEKNGSYFVLSTDDAQVHSELLDPGELRQNPGRFTILDIREQSELHEEGKIFEHAVHIPLHALRERVAEVPAGKPIVVHCSGGYRSAIGASMLDARIGGVPVYDLGEYVEQFA